MAAAPETLIAKSAVLARDDARHAEKLVRLLVLANGFLPKGTIVWISNFPAFYNSRTRCENQCSTYADVSFPRELDRERIWHTAMSLVADLLRNKQQSIAHSADFVIKILCCIALLWPTPDFMSVGERSEEPGLLDANMAAKRLGLTPARVRQLLRKGVFSRRRKGRVYGFSPEEIENYNKGRHARKYGRCLV